MGKRVDLFEPQFRQFLTFGHPCRVQPWSIISRSGSTPFALATGGKKGDVNLVGAYGAEAMSAAILRAVRRAKSAGGLLAWRDL